MKRFENLIIGILFISVPALNQDLLDEGNTWKIIDSYDIVLGGTAHCYENTIVGDTIIDTLTYKIISQMKSGNPEIVGFLRKQENLKYFFRDIYGNEGLVYDFDVSLNDTISLYNPALDTNHSFSIVVIDSTTTNISNRQVTRYVVETVSTPTEVPKTSEVWISGIGSLNGLLNCGFDILGLVGAQPELLCFFSSDSLIYLDNDYSNCSCNPNSIEKTNLRSLDIFIYPNPAEVGDIIKIKIKSPISNSFFEIYDVTGQILAKDYNPGVENEFDFPVLLKSGIYLVKIQADSSILISKLIVK